MACHDALRYFAHYEKWQHIKSGYDSEWEHADTAIVRNNTERADNDRCDNVMMKVAATALVGKPMDEPTKNLEGEQAGQKPQGLVEAQLIRA